MDCNVITTALQPCLARTNMKRIDKFQVNKCRLNAKRLNNQNRVLIGKSPVHHERWRVLRTPTSLEDEYLPIQPKNLSKDEESDSDEEVIALPPSSEALKALLYDSERSKLIKKLSEANQQNRYLKRELQVKEDALVNFKSELAVIELEIQALVGLAEEIANYKIPEGSRKINGKYLQSHLLSRLGAVQKKLEEQIKDVGSAQSQEVPVFWHGVAESVQVMGSFDGWSQGEHLSPEYTGSYTTFSTNLVLRPGRYQIKFLVDGEWHLSPEFPTIGEGLMQNNLLIVE